MSFDAFMLGAVAFELKEKLNGARVEKVLQPSKDEIFFQLHNGKAHTRLQINAGASAPRIGITTENPENPKVPPMFCMLLRKHLTGARITDVKQYGFERALEIEFETYDEMGYLTKRRLICEIMGRYSNAVLCGNDLKVMGVLRPADISVSRKRPLIPQMTYEYPPAQDKKDPTCETEEGFFDTVTEISEKALTGAYLGMSPFTAREIVYRAGEGADKEKLWRVFSDYVLGARERRYSPTLICNENGEPYEFSPFEVKQYGDRYKTIGFETLGELTDAFFAVRERLGRERQRSAATEKLLKNIENRLVKKLDIQKNELKDTEKKSEYKKKADLITANIYKFSGKCESVTVTDYVEDENGNYKEEESVIKIERGSTPTQYAQKLYKKYNKAKKAEIEIKAQMEKAESELEYIRSVRDALSRINGQAELEEIQRELAEAGYEKRTSYDKKSVGNGKKLQNNAKRRIGEPLKFVTSGGFTVLVGKNNIQNDNLTFKVASKNDYWFHLKGRPGSHTVLFCDGGEPSEKDLTEAAELAAANSKAKGEERAEVDYTRIKNVKKPSGARPGFVIYDNYKTALVSAKKTVI